MADVWVKNMVRTGSLILALLLTGATGYISYEYANKKIYAEKRQVLFSLYEPPELGKVIIDKAAKKASITIEHRMKVNPKSYTRNDYRIYIQADFEQSDEPELCLMEERVYHFKNGGGSSNQPYKCGKTIEKRYQNSVEKLLTTYAEQLDDKDLD